MVSARKLGKHELIDVLGGGGNGTVWRARTPEGSDVALKVLKNVREQAYKRFHAEVTVLLKLKEWSGIVPILDSHLPTGLSKSDPPWYTMPLAKEAYKKPPSNVEMVLSSFLPLCKTLERLHAEKIVHRDIKPANVLWYKGLLCFSDFGLVKFPGREKLTKNKESIGPKSTIAPEMRRNPLRADPYKADVYSLAKTLWIFLTGDHHGFEGQYSPDSSLSLHARTDVRAVDMIDTLLTDATESDPKKRPSAAQFVVEIEKWINLVKDDEATIHHEWAVVGNVLFPGGVPAQAEWKGAHNIVKVLRSVINRGRINHCFLPDGGGLDLTGVVQGSEKDTIELDLQGCRALVKPDTLRFVQIDNDPQWAFFRLDAGKIGRTGIYEDKGVSESVLEISPKKYVDHRFYDLNEIDGKPLPDGARLLVRYNHGAFLIAHRVSIYNKISETYDGRHNAMSAKQFREYMGQLRSVAIGKGQESAEESESSDFVALKMNVPFLVTFPAGESAFQFLTLDEIRRIAEVAEEQIRKERQDPVTFQSIFEEKADPIKLEIGKLDRRKLNELIALYWFGRDAAPSLSNWRGCVAHAFEDKNSDEEQVRYISEKAPIAQCLREGVEKLGLSL